MAKGGGTGPHYLSALLHSEATAGEGAGYTGIHRCLDETQLIN